MKKLFFSLCMLFAAANMNAQQTIVNPGILDNIYVGANVGLNTNLAGNKFFPMNPTISLRVGKDITPIFGVNIEGTCWLGSTIEHRNRFDYQPILREVDDENDGTLMVPDVATAHNLIRSFNLGINGTMNLTNLFMGYAGIPRPVEVSTIAGLGWGHNFVPSNPGQLVKNEDSDFLTAKTGLDITYNFGSDLQHQVYIEPAILWNLNKDGHSCVKMNKHGAFLQLAVGYNYKFGCSYGGHNFKYGMDNSAEIDRLNALLQECYNRPPKIEYVQGETRTIKVENLVLVTFEQGKSILTEDALSALNGVPSGAHVQIIGTASPEGSAEWNQQLSQNRADAVADYLRDRGVIVDSAEGRGVQGNTSNRLAIVYIK